MSCDVMMMMWQEGHRKHITKVLQTAGMTGGSEERKDALLPRTPPTAGHTGNSVQLQLSSSFNIFTQRCRISSLLQVCVVLNSQMRVIGIRTRQESASLSRRKIPQLRVKTLLFIIRKYQSWKHNLCSFKCKIQYLTNYTLPLSPRSKSSSPFVRSWVFIFAIEYTAI